MEVQSKWKNQCSDKKKILVDFFQLRFISVQEAIPLTYHQYLTG